jgi:hypothetical protein
MAAGLASIIGAHSWFSKELYSVVGSGAFMDLPMKSKDDES